MAESSFLHTTRTAYDAVTELPAVFAEFERVLASGAHVLLGFYADDHTSGAPREFDHKVALAYRWPLGALAALLREAGLIEVARMAREPGDGERFLQGCLLVRKP
ncbi:hypothetical protein [Sinosporangium siamense]|uniref:Methyltransferase n=1 Tax=Sinosporangium siamense TaxID=1367973 RepID=A0A919RJJ5_9ACTN|nr:hypothetical protein [Sinosporangium siamense]GII95016.1 hypothetical protein Ssi02_52470 [Sinosporangium siamense]